MSVSMNSLKKVLNWGVENETQPQLKKKIAITNLIAVTLSLVTYPYALIFYLVDAKVLAALVLPIASIYLGIPYLNRLGHSVAARLVLITTFNSAVFFYATNLGLATGIQWLFFCLACLPLILFESLHKGKIIYGIILSFSLMLMAHGLEGQGWTQPGLSQDFARIVYYSMIPTTFIILLAIVIYFHSVNQKAEHSLEDSLHRLEHTTTHIRTIFDNINQGICTIGPGGLLQDDFSAHFLDLVKPGTSPGQHLRDFLLADSQCSKDEQTLIADSLEISIGQDSLNYLGNLDKFPTKLHYNWNGERRIYEVDWLPITNRQDVVTRIMLVIRDVSALHQLQIEAQQKSQDLAMMTEIAQCGLARFPSFLQSVQHLEQSMEATMRQPNAMTEFLRQLHNLKGNGRTFGLKTLVDAIHQAESSLASPAPSRGDTQEQSQAVYQNLHRIIGIYQNCYSRYFSVQSDAQAGFETFKEKAISLCEQLQLRHPTVYAELQPEIDGLLSLDRISLRALVHPIEESLASLAIELQKPKPRLYLREQSLVAGRSSIDFTRRVARELTDVFTHLVRNSLDHGFVDDREHSIEILVMHKNGSLVIDYRDDGRGLDLNAIKKRAAARGLSTDGRTDRELAAMIFLPEFSTASKVTEISGRGIGMYAIEKALEALGGRFEMITHTAKDGFIPFHFCMNLPDDHGRAVARVA